MSTTWSEATDIVLRDILYNLSITFEGSEGNERLIIDLEDLQQNIFWQGSFSSAYIKSLTIKTGSYKDIGVFARMIQSTLCATSKSVELDVLTTSDLERMMSPTQMQNTTEAGKPLQQLLDKSKRYLLITYTSEFEFIRYPLPLTMVTEPSNEFQQRLIQRLRRELDLFKALAKTTDAHIPLFLKDEANPAIQTSFSQSILAVYRQLRIQQNTVQEYERRQSEYSRKISDLEKKARQILEKYRSSQTTIESMKKIHEQEISELRKQMVQSLSADVSLLNTSSVYFPESRGSNVYYPRVRELSVDREPSMASTPRTSKPGTRSTQYSPQLTQAQAEYTDKPRAPSESMLQERMDSLESENRELSDRIGTLIRELQEARDRERSAISTHRMSSSRSYTRRSQDRTPTSARSTNDRISGRSSVPRNLPPTPRRTPGTNLPSPARLYRSASMSSLSSASSIRSDMSVQTSTSTSTGTWSRSRNTRAQRVPVSSPNSAETTGPIRGRRLSTSTTRSNRSSGGEYVSPYAQRRRGRSQDTRSRSHSRSDARSIASQSSIPRPQSPLSTSSRSHVPSPFTRSSSLSSYTSRVSHTSHTSHASPESHTSRFSRTPRLSARSTPRRISPTIPSPSTYPRNTPQSNVSARSRVSSRMGRSPARSEYVSPYNQNVLRGRNPSTERQRLSMSRRKERGGQMDNNSSTRSPRVNRQLYVELDKSDSRREYEYEYDNDSFMDGTEEEQLHTSHESIHSAPRNLQPHSPSNTARSGGLANRTIHTVVSHEPDGYSTAGSEGISVDLSAKRLIHAHEDKGRLSFGNIHNITTSPTSTHTGSPGTPSRGNEVDLSHASTNQLSGHPNSLPDLAQETSESTHGSAASLINSLRVDTMDLSLPSLGDFAHGSEFAASDLDHDKSEFNVTVDTNHSSKTDDIVNMDISVDIDDIDKRLANLQEFLAGALT